MTQQAKEIIAELMKLEPDLIDKRQELENVVEEMICAKPDLTLNEEFRADLRRRLILTAETPKRALNWSMLLSNLKPGLIGAGVMAIIAIAISLPNNRVTEDQHFPLLEENTAGDVQKSALGSIAFGYLGSAVSDSNNIKTTAESSQNTPTPPTVLSATPTIAMGAGGSFAPGNASDMSGDAKLRTMPVTPEYVEHTFSYEGKIELPTEDVKVLRLATSDLTSNIGLNMTGHRIGGMDLGMFSGSKLQNLTLVDDSTYGHTISVDGTNGSVYLNQNWQKWSLDMNCVLSSSAPCDKAQQISLSELPSDDVSIDIALDFIDSYGISTKSFGEPYVDNSWRRDHDFAVARGETPWIPEQVTVIFPMVFDGMEVIDETGVAQGLRISVDVRARRVASAGPIRDIRIESSNYPAINDLELFKKALRKGGSGSAYYYGAAVKSINHELVSPTPVYLMQWKWQDGIGSQLLIPALRFDVAATEATAEWYRPTVVMPLASDFYVISNDQPIILPAADYTR